MKGDTVKLVSVGTVTLATFVARAADGSTELVNPATGATITLTTKAEMKTLVRVKKAAVVPKVRVRSIPSWAAAAASSTADVAVKPIALVTITKTKVDKWGYVNVASLSVSSLTFCDSPRSTYANIILNSLAIYLLTMALRISSCFSKVLTNGNKNRRPEACRTTPHCDA